MNHGHMNQRQMTWDEVVGELRRFTDVAAVRAKEIEALRAENARLREFVAEVPIGCYEHGQGQIKWCDHCNLAAKYEALRNELKLVSNA